MEPIVSICIPVYNGARWLDECLRSVMACSLPCEIIVCDDCSTDSSAAIVRNYAQQDSRIAFSVNEKNLGLVGNWNRCLELAKGKWIKFLFQDDRAGEGAIEKMVAAAGESDMLIAARRNYFFTENSSDESRKYYTETVLSFGKIAPGKTRFSPAEIASYTAAYFPMNFIGEPSTVMFRKSVIAAAGFFNESLKQICDLEYWLRIASQHGLRYVPDAVMDFRVHDESVSAQNYQQKKSGHDALRLADSVLHDPVFGAFRKNIPQNSLRRLRIWTRLHAYEARKNAVNPDERKSLEALFVERPQLRWYSGKFGNALLYKLLQWKRG